MILSGKLLRLTNSTYKHRTGDLVINWGNTRADPEYPLLNPPRAIQRVSNKLSFFQLMRDEGLTDIIPNFWTNKEDIPDDAFPIVCRTILSGHSGAGIIISDCRDDLVDAPLYTQYLKKKDEYRVHCGLQSSGQTGLPWLGTVISLQRKARRLDHEEPNWQVRNHANGFVYVRNDLNPPECVQEVALQAFRATGLDFGAADVIYNEAQDRAYVLEINTAPGLEGQTVEDYKNFFLDIYPQS
jgi:glutathione synthase/RimK-type ligase-like ATP-grasp enzyme